MLGFMYHHNALHNYWERLDRWYLLNTQQFTDFTLQSTLDHSVILSDHALVWLTMNVGIHVDDLHAHTIRLKHVNVME